MQNYRVFDKDFEEVSVEELEQIPAGGDPEFTVAKDVEDAKKNTQDPSFGWLLAEDALRDLKKANS